MGSPEQDPRSLPSARPALRLTAVMAGMEWVDPNGRTRISPDDVVLVETMDPEDGTPAATVSFSPDAALSLAVAVQAAAIKLINAEVKDDGTKYGPLERMARINNAYKETE